MDAPSFDAISRAVASGGTSRRQVVRLLAGSALAGAGLVRVSTDVEALSRCCRKQKRRFRRAKNACEKDGGQLLTEFSCDRATCDPDIRQVFVCQLSLP